MLFGPPAHDDALDRHVLGRLGRGGGGRLRRRRAAAVAAAVVATTAEGEGRDQREAGDRHRGQRPRPQPAPRRRVRGEDGRRLVGRDDGLLAVAGCGLADRHQALGRRRHRSARCRERGTAEVAGGGEAIVGVLGHRAGQDGVEARRRVRRAVMQRGRVVVEVGPQGRLVALALIRRHAGERVVEHAAQRVDVGARVEALAADLLGRDVAERPDPAAVAGGAGVRGHALGEPEVGQVGVVVGAEQDVGGLDVAVDDAARVRRVERAGHLGDDVRRAGRVAGGARRARACAGRRLDVAHRDVERPVVALARVVDRDDVGVVDRRRGARLADEAIAEVGVLGELRGDELQRDRAIEVELERSIDHPHAAAARDPQDAVAGELVSLVQAGHRAFVQEAPQAPESRRVRRRRYPRPRRCAVRAPSVRPRGGLWCWAWLRRSSAGASASRRPWSPAPPPRRRSGCPWPCAARRSATSASCACRCTPTSTSYQMPNDDPERLRARVRMRLPGGRRPHHRPRRAARACACSAPSRAARASPCGPSSRRSCGATGCGSACPHGTRRLPAHPPARAVRARCHADLRGVRPRAHRLLGAAHGAPVVRGAKRVPSDRASPACAG